VLTGRVCHERGPPPCRKGVPAIIPPAVSTPIAPPLRLHAPGWRCWPRPIVNSPLAARTRHLATTARPGTRRPGRSTVGSSFAVAPSIDLVEFALVCFELPFQVTARLAHLTNARSRLCSCRTTFCDRAFGFSRLCGTRSPESPPCRGSGLPGLRK
jgi:hypothetical protein